VDQVQFLARSFQPIVLAGVPLPRFPPTCSAAAVTRGSSQRSTSDSALGWQWRWREDFRRSNLPSRTRHATAGDAPRHVRPTLTRGLVCILEVGGALLSFVLASKTGGRRLKRRDLSQCRKDPRIGSTDLRRPAHGTHEMV
jgi:hypothetical protein